MVMFQSRSLCNLFSLGLELCEGINESFARAAELGNQNVRYLSVIGDSFSFCLSQRGKGLLLVN